MKIAILGGGISGVSLCDILQKRYGIRSDIYEKENEFGGLCRTTITDGFVYDISGGHIFNTKFENVKEYIFSLLEMDKWQLSQRISKIVFDDKIIDYPFEFSLSQVQIDVAVECIEGLYTRKECYDIKNFEQYLIQNFGEGIFKYYLKPYNEKVWKYPTNKLDFDWVFGKMPYPKPAEILKRTLSQETNESSMVHSSYYYPLNGGIQALLDSMSKELDKTHLGEKIDSIEYIEGKICVNGNFYDMIINTIPLPELVDVIKELPVNVKDAIRNLKYNSVSSYLFETEKEHNWSWTYIPDNSVIPNRVVYQGNLSKYACPQGKGSVTAEITKPQLYNEEEILLNIKEKLGLNKLIDEHFTKYAYVVFDLDRRSNMEIVSKYFNEKNILLHGRFAEWTYPNMDVCVNNSFNVAELIYNKYFL